MRKMLTAIALAVPLALGAVPAASAVIHAAPAMHVHGRVVADAAPPDMHYHG